MGGLRSTGLLELLAVNCASSSPITSARRDSGTSDHAVIARWTCHAEAEGSPRGSRARSTLTTTAVELSIWCQRAGDEGESTVKLATALESNATVPSGRSAPPSLPERAEIGAGSRSRTSSHSSRSQAGGRAVQDLGATGRGPRFPGAIVRCIAIAGFRGAAGTVRATEARSDRRNGSGRAPAVPPGTSPRPERSRTAPSRPLGRGATVNFPKNIPVVRSTPSRPGSRKTNTFSFRR